MTVDDSPFGRHESMTEPPGPAAGWLRAQVRSFMCPGVVSVSGDASLLQVQRAMITHGVHAVLIAGPGAPLGWVTAAGLLPWLGEDPALYRAASAISEEPAWISPSASAAEALQALADPAVSHLIVTPRPDTPAQGVVSEVDLVRLACRA